MIYLYHKVIKSHTPRQQKEICFNSAWIITDCRQYMYEVSWHTIQFLPTFIFGMIQWHHTTKLKFRPKDWSGPGFCFQDSPSPSNKGFHLMCH